MGISKKTAEKLKYLWDEANKKSWIETFIKIVNKEQKLVPFILTKQQREFVKNMQSKNCVLKQRQCGLSVVVLALSIRKAIVTPNSACLIMSYKQSSATDNFDKLKQMYNSLPNWLKPKIIADNRQELKFANGSKITCVVAGNKDNARGATLSICHCTEVAYYSNIEKHLGALSKAMTSDGVLTLESTANGVNAFHDIYFQAERQENDYKAFFFSWIQGRELFENHYKKAVEKYKALHNGKMLTMEELDEEEQELIKMGATLDQLVFRRFEIAETSLQNFHQERPSTPGEAFVTSSSSMFDSKKIAEVERALVINKVKHIPKENIILPQSLQPYYGRNLFIWKIPSVGERFWGGVDMSENVGKDFTCIEVLDSNGELVCEFFTNKIKNYLMAEIIFEIGKFFNNTMLTIERNFGGHNIISKLKNELGYTNLVKYKTYDEFLKIVYQEGFSTNTKTKGILIRDLVEAFERDLIKINSRRVLQEFKTYVLDESGSMGAISSGCHDDTTMALGMAYSGLKSGIYYGWKN